MSLKDYNADNDYPEKVIRFIELYNYWQVALARSSPKNNLYGVLWVMGTIPYESRTESGMSGYVRCPPNGQIIHTSWIPTCFETQ